MMFRNSQSTLRALTQLNTTFQSTSTCTRRTFTSFASFSSPLLSSSSSSSFQRRATVFAFQPATSAAFRARRTFVSSTAAADVPSTPAAVKLEHPKTENTTNDNTSSSNNSENKSDENDSKTNDSSSGENKGEKKRSRNPFVNFFRKFGEYYNEQMESHPWRTQMIQSGILGFAADYTTQHFEHGWDNDDGFESSPWDYRRLAAVTAFGIFGMGPMGHVWYEMLDKFTSKICRTNMQMVIAKILGDTFVFGPVCLWLFFVSVSIMEGTDWETIRTKLWRDFVPTYIVDYCMWPVVQGINFHFFPVRLQLLFVNTMCYFDDIFLSYVQHNELPVLFQKVEDWWAKWIRSTNIDIGNADLDAETRTPLAPDSPLWKTNKHLIAKREKQQREAEEAAAKAAAAATTITPTAPVVAAIKQ